MARRYAAHLRLIELGKRDRLARMRPGAHAAAAGAGRETAEPLVAVAHEARLAAFAVVDHVDAEFGLPADDGGDRVFQHARIGLRIDRFAAQFCAHHGDQVGGARQAADVSGENAVG